MLQPAHPLQADQPVRPPSAPLHPHGLIPGSRYRAPAGFKLLSHFTFSADKEAVKKLLK